MHKTIGYFIKKVETESAHGEPNGRESGFGPSAKSAIWRRGVPTNEKDDRPLRREGVITHASRPEAPANVIAIVKLMRILYGASLLLQCLLLIQVLH